MQKTSSVATRQKELKLLPWKKFPPLKVFKFGKKSKAAVILDQAGRPQLFLLDTFALLDMLSDIDEALIDKLSTEEYNSKTVNPAGWLIDELESKLPLNPQFISSLKKAIEESNKKGWIPFSKIQTKLGLS